MSHDAQTAGRTRPERPDCARHRRHPRHRPRHRAQRSRREGWYARTLWAGADAEVPVRREALAQRARRSAPTSTTSRPMWRVTARSDAARRAPSLARFGAIDALVNNAGRAPRVRADLLEATEGELRRTGADEPAGPVLPDAARRAVARRRGSARRRRSARRHRVRDVGLGDDGRRRTAATIASARRGSRWRRKLFAARLAPHGVPVYEVRPGIIATDMTAARQGGLRPAHCRRARSRKAAGARPKTSAAWSRHCCAATCVRDRLGHPRGWRALDSTTLIHRVDRWPLALAADG